MNKNNCPICGKFMKKVLELSDEHCDCYTCERH